MKDNKQKIKNIFLAGSSHTRILFLYLKDFMGTDAVVSKLPYDAGNTAEILGTIGFWPLKDKNVVHVYSGHRDLMPDEAGIPFIVPQQFRQNLKKIIEILRSRTSGTIIFSNIPPVADSFLHLDSDRNNRISEYNQIIGEITGRAGIAVHDFHGFVVNYPKSEGLYSDGLHFTRKFYRIYAADLADFLRRLL